LNDSSIREIRRIIFSENAVEEAIQKSIKKNPSRIADIIFPIIGVSIRKAVTDYFEKMMMAFNQALENSFSVKGLKWRWQAMKSGRPYSEVVMLNNLIFMVEDVFLIHRPSGILLVHCSRIDAGQRADRIAGMLSALHDFIGQTFSEKEANHQLRQMKVGEVNLIVEEAPNLLLVAALKGVPSPSYRVRMQEYVADIHTRFEDQLDSFSGDTVVFDSLKDELEKLIDVQQVTREEKKDFTVYRRIFIFLLILGGSSFYWISHKFYEQRKIDHDLLSFLSKAESMPGVVIINYQKIDQTWVIRLIKDEGLDLPRLPSSLRGKIQIIEKTFPTQPPLFLTDLAIPYERDTAGINGDPTEQINLLTHRLKFLAFNKVVLHAFGESEKLKLMLSSFIGKLESALLQQGGRNAYVFKYVLHRDSKREFPSLIRFELK